MSSTEFIKFYENTLGLDKNDFDLFIKVANTPLPSTFRISNARDKPAILRKLTEYNDLLTKVEYLDDVFTFSLKEKTPLYKEFIQFLVAQTNIGNIQRQEIVSMLPHLFLDLKEDSCVLETCASPGSKTKQLLETVKTGLVISNDRSPSRTNVLITEAVKKATPSFIVTMADASRFPKMGTKFDRICCDVPCSSDGTMRKNIPVYEKWSVDTATGICNLQYRILERALKLLKDDGLLVYSTCSLNPIENEYVINKILEKGEQELVLDTSKIQYANDDPSKIMVRRGITKFDYNEYSFENAELSKCIRILPHDQNTGGFFIAVLRNKPERKNEETWDKQLTKDKTDIKGFYEVPHELMNKIGTSFGSLINRKVHFVSQTENYKSIYSISDVAYRFICENPRLKISHIGIKSLIRTDLDNNSYRAKSAFLEQMIAEPTVWAT
ncbi:tRNA (cytosine34-C5)-methyltransferase, partial [Pancytospora epiphaga]